MHVLIGKPDFGRGAMAFPMYMGLPSGFAADCLVEQWENAEVVGTWVNSASLGQQRQ